MPRPSMPESDHQAMTEVSDNPGATVGNQSPHPSAELAELSLLNGPLLAHELRVPDPVDPLVVYDQLTSPTGSVTFSQRIESEEAQFANAASGLASLTGRRAIIDRKRDFLRTRRDQWDRHRRMVFRYDEPVTGELTHGLVSHARGADQAAERTFLSEAEFAELVGTSKPRITIDARERPLTFPLSAVISARGLESWETGRGDSSKKEGRSSRAIIEDYASRPTEIPPLDEALAAILPDGQVVLISDSAHRAAAAHHKGQATIQVKEVSVVRAENTLTGESPPATQP